MQSNLLVDISLLPSSRNSSLLPLGVKQKNRPMQTLNILIELIEMAVYAVLQIIIVNIGKVIVAVVTIAIGVIAAYYTYKNYRLQKEELSRMPSLRICLFHPDIPEELYILLPFAVNKLFIVPLPFVIENSGDKTAKNVELIANIPDSYYQRDNTKRQISNVAVARKMVHVSDRGRTKHIAQCYAKIPDIPLRSASCVEERILASDPTVAKFPVSAKDKRGIQLTADVRVIYSIVIETQCFCEDILPTKKNFRLNFRHGSKNEFNQFLLEENELLSEQGQDAISKKHNVSRSVGIVCFEEFQMVPHPEDIAEHCDEEIIVYKPKRSSTKFVVGKLGSRGLTVPARKWPNKG